MKTRGSLLVEKVVAVSVVVVSVVVVAVVLVMVSGCGGDGGGLWW